MGAHQREQVGLMAIARRRDHDIPAIELTKMRRRHLRKVLAIESQVYPRPWSASLFLSEISQRANRSYLVAKRGSDVVGYAGMMFTGVDAHVTNIAVDPALQGRKVGTRLLLTLVTEALARACDTISLEVRVTNTVAQTMYEKFGFSVSGLRKGYYIETNEDALIMVVDDALSTDYRLRLQSIREQLDELDRNEHGDE